MKLAPTLLAAALAATPAAAQDATWTIPQRPLPPPAHASAELRAHLAHLPQPDLAAERRFQAKTAAEWKAFLAASDAGIAELAQKVVDETGVRVEEASIGGVHVYRLTPKTIRPEHASHLFVHVHGGAWVANHGLAGAGEGVEIAAKLGIKVISVDYRMPPDFPAPAALDDVVAVWRELIKDHAPQTVMLGGTSAGGTLTLAATLRLKDLALPLPGALMVGTPVIDLAKAGDSRYVNDGVDAGLTWEGFVEQAVALYAAGKDLKDPYLSPVYGDVHGFPPTYLVTGTRDLMLSDTVVMHRKLKQADVEAELNVYEGLSHAEYATLFGYPESDEHYADLDAFAKKHLAK